MDLKTVGGQNNHYLKPRRRARANGRTRERMRARVMWIRRLTVYTAVASPRTSRAESLASGFGLRD